MAYFDSSKNRALWEIRLGELRKERAAKEAGGSAQAFEREPQKKEAGITRVPVSYQQLLKQEAMASEKNKKRERGAGMDREKARQKEEQAHEMA